MRVTQRLYLAAFPSVLGVIAVAALAYWGQFARAVPESILLVAAIATVSTMILSWTNVRYVAERVERLARRTSAVHVAHSSDDELDTIEDVVAGLNSAFHSEQTGRREDQAALQRRRMQYARVLADAAENAIRGLNEIRLPLHILLENHFGELNENQEEMLAAARSAADSIDHDFAALGELARMDLGEITMRNDRIFPADLVHAILPTVNAIAEARNVTINSDIAALIAPIAGDGVRLQGALLALITEEVRALPAGTQFNLSLKLDNECVTVSLQPARSRLQNARVLLARRTIVFGGGSLVEIGEALNIRLGPEPRAPALMGTL